MIHYIFVHKYNTGLPIFDITNTNSIIISGCISAIQSLINQVFSVSDEKLKSIRFSNKKMKNFTLFEDLKIDIFYIFDKEDKSLIKEISPILRDIIIQYRPHFESIKENQSNSQIFEPLKNAINSYLNYWTYKKKIDKVSINQ
jgi:hypothetical protein